MADFYLSWQRAWTGLGAVGDPAGVLAQLLARYQEPQRHYHTLEHLGECLDNLVLSEHLAERPAELAWALWFHDAIYEPRRSDNEEQSALWVLAVLQAAAVAPAVQQRVQQLILATRHQSQAQQHTHKQAQRQTQSLAQERDKNAPLSDADLLVDIDLAILGAPAPRFAAYEQQIRREYAHVPELQFASGRRALLQSFLERPRLYSSEYFFQRLEAQARHNLRASINSLIP